MYLSHAVRTIRDDPMAEESVDLVVTRTESDADVEPDSAEFADEIDTLDGEIVAELQFSAVHVRLPETAVEALCELDGIDRIETAETLRLVGDDAVDPPDDGGRGAATDTPTEAGRNAPDDVGSDVDRDREQ